VTGYDFTNFQAAIALTLGNEIGEIVACHAFSLIFELVESIYRCPYNVVYETGIDRDRRRCCGKTRIYRAGTSAQAHRVYPNGDTAGALEAGGTGNCGSIPKAS
jgi:hypothetical protein